MVIFVRYFKRIFLNIKSDIPLIFLFINMCREWNLYCSGNKTMLMKRPNRTYRNNGWCSLFVMMSTGIFALGIAMTFRANYQTRFTMGNRPPISVIWVIYELVVHPVAIHTAQYTFTMLCKVHLMSRLTLKINLSRTSVVQDPENTLSVWSHLWQGHIYHWFYDFCVTTV